MKIVKKSDMEQIVRNLYPKLSFEDGVSRLVKDNEVTTMRSYGHYNVMDKLLKYL